MPAWVDVTPSSKIWSNKISPIKLWSYEVYSDIWSSVASLPSSWSFQTYSDSWIDRVDTIEVVNTDPYIDFDYITVGYYDDDNVWLNVSDYTEIDAKSWPDEADDSLKTWADKSAPAGAWSDLSESQAWSDVVIGTKVWL